MREERRGVEWSGVEWSLKPERMKKEERTDE